LLEQATRKIRIDHIYVDVLIVLLGSIARDITTPQWHHDNIELLTIGKGLERVWHLGYNQVGW
jgi:hypothetical protein